MGCSLLPGDLIIRAVTKSNDHAINSTPAEKDSPGLNSPMPFCGDLLGGWRHKVTVTVQDFKPLFRQDCEGGWCFHCIVLFVVPGGPRRQRVVLLSRKRIALRLYIVNTKNMLGFFLILLARPLLFIRHG